MNNVLRQNSWELVISHGGTEKWVRKENPVVEAKAVLVNQALFNAQGVVE